MKSYLNQLIYFFVNILTILLLILVSIYYKISRRSRKKVIFGTTPILNNKYWSQALNEYGIDSETLMKTYSNTINKKEDYDQYFEDLIPFSILNHKYMQKIVKPFFVWLYIIKNAKVFVLPFNGVVLSKYLWKFEYILFKINGIKIIVLPFGGDAYMFSRIIDPSLQNALLLSNPIAGKYEKDIEKRVFFWSKYADFTINAYMGIDGMPRWDIPIISFLQINNNDWKKKLIYSNNNGKNGIVKIIHSPNSRGFKGTEFLLDAVNELKKEGFLIDLILLEKVQNDEVNVLMQEADILAEQFIATGYALSGIEGMSSGLAVLSNLDNRMYTEVFRRYSFLNECPILSTSPETIKENLKLLIENPKLRKELGILGTKYVEKYHSYKMTQHMFSHILKKLDGENIDLMNLYHPLKSEYVKTNYINTPLINNKYKKDN